MSNALAIASVTAVLKNLLTNGLIGSDSVASVGDFSVTTLPPDRIRGEQATEASQLNLFLHQVTPNPGWRNAALPSRNSAGEPTTNPALALDLHYLLTAYGTENLASEILLGTAMQLLHETPALSREVIRTSLTHAGTAGLPAPVLQALAEAQLADQLEQIKITPEFLNTEEMSKLWTALGTHYRPSAAYQVSVVLIEGRRPLKPALPVRERNMYALPFQQPRVVSVQAASGPGDSILPGGTILIKGLNLRGETTTVLSDGFAVPVPASDVSPVQITVALPDTLRAGIHALQVANEFNLGTPPVPHRGIESNVAAFLLHPKITVPAPAAGSIAITFNPKVAKAQRVRLLLNETPAPANRPACAYSLSAPKDNGITDAAVEDTATISFPLTGVEAGDYFVRVQVDGAESALITDTTEGSPTFNQFIGPKITV